MGTFEATTRPMVFEQMAILDKTVFVVPVAPAYEGISSGDRIEFEDLGSITIGSIRRYGSVEALLEAEGWHNVVPEAKDAVDAASNLRTLAAWGSHGEEHGLLALRVREAKRKA